VCILFSWVLHLPSSLFHLRAPCFLYLKILCRLPRAAVKSFCEEGSSCFCCVGSYASRGRPPHAFHRVPSPFPHKTLLLILRQSNYAARAKIIYIGLPPPNPPTKKHPNTPHKPKRQNPKPPPPQVGLGNERFCGIGNVCMFAVILSVLCFLLRLDNRCTAKSL